MNERTRSARLLLRIRCCLAVVVAGLVVSGVTAFPLVRETGWLVRVLAAAHAPVVAQVFVGRVHRALLEQASRYPFLAYGTDWLAFAHLVIALAFYGPWRDPVRNRWVLLWGLWACAGVLPLALIAGGERGLPLWWRLGDCCFGVFGAIPLLLALRWTRDLEALT